MIVSATILLIVISPLLGGVIAYFRPKQAHAVSTSFTGLAAAAAFLMLITYEDPFSLQWLWLSSLKLSIYVDQTSVILSLLVCFVSLLVQVFSAEYMRNDSSKRRYFAKLGFFTFSMVGLLVADSLILLFIFWELVGFASYLLIGFWYQKSGVPRSARIAFMVNRVADVALISGILMLNGELGTMTLTAFEGKWLFLPSLFIAIGAFGKSAQLPFAGWLTKAMVGPTPVSALIHAATMVAAGVYLLFRVAPYLAPEVLLIAVFIGLATALYGAVSAVVQNDIKKVLAYSTISQLGYMVLGVGVGAGDAAMFHLWTHAFFKAGLFLGAGSIIHYLHRAASSSGNEVDAQDMRNMGGLGKILPWTFRSFLVCSLALVGIPLFSGFMSKEGIILASWTWAEQFGTWAYLVPDLALVTVLVTALYVGRMVLLVFFGKNRVAEITEKFRFSEKWLVRMPLILLAIGSFWILYNWNPLAHESWISEYFGASTLRKVPFSSVVITTLSILFSAGGLLLAFFLFKPGTDFAKAYARTGEPTSLGGKVLAQGFYLTRAYEGVGRMILIVSSWFSWVDKRVIDALIHFFAVGGVVLAKVLDLVDKLVIDGLVNAVSKVAVFLGRRFSGIHARQIQWQLIWLLILFVLLLGWVLIGR